MKKKYPYFVLLLMVAHFEPEIKTVATYLPIVIKVTLGDL